MPDSIFLGGGNPFDQDLNTDDDVVFASVDIAGEFTLSADAGDSKMGISFSDNFDFITDQSGVAIRHWNQSGAGSTSQVSAWGLSGGFPIQQAYWNLYEDYAWLATERITAGNGPSVLIQAADGNTEGNGGSINLITGALAGGGANGELTINGTPGVTAGPFTTITSITVTKGIITALTGS